MSTGADGVLRHAVASEAGAADDVWLRSHDAVRDCVRNVVPPGEA
ncbi:hypothetical protein [Streptomyces shenzhenensis]|nr:hypothetical protein [Streptomyces shenzhenensis]